MENEVVSFINTNGRNVNFEELRSINQELSFEVLKKELTKRDIVFGNSQMETLKIIGEDGLYTNLAYILSDQCEYTTKLAIFQGVEKTLFRERKEFSGSILKQLNEVFNLIELINKTQATFHGLDRIDTKDFPIEAVREALLNAYVHRDYSLGGSIIVNIYDDKMEIVSLGGLVYGISIDSIYLGVSKTRNENLAKILYRMRLIESFGTGIDKINRMYKECKVKPKFETAPGVFRVTLPNVNFINNTSVNDNDVETLIVKRIKELHEVTRKDIENDFKIAQTKAYNILKNLCENGIIKEVGNGKTRKYVYIK